MTRNCSDNVSTVTSRHVGCLDSAQADFQ